MHLTNDLDQWTNALVVLQEDGDSQDQAGDLSGEEVLEREIDVEDEVAQCSLDVLSVVNISCVQVFLDVGSEPADEDDTAHKQNRVGEVEDHWEFVKTA